MSDAANPWQMSIVVEPGFHYDSPEAHLADLAMAEAGYRGVTVHPSPQVAMAAAHQLLDKLYGLRPELGWQAIVCWPHVGQLTQRPGEGSAFVVPYPREDSDPQDG